MAVQFPDPADATTYEYISPDGCVARYEWDGNKWKIPCLAHTAVDDIDGGQYPN